MKTTSTTPNEDYKFNPKDAWPGSLALIGQAFRAVREKPDFAYIFLGIQGLLALLDYVVAPTPFFHLSLASDSNPGHTSLMITMLTILVGLALTAPLSLYQLRLAQGRPIVVRDILTSGLRRILGFFLMNIVIIVCVFAGLLLFIVPGIIIGLRLILANYAFFDMNLGPLEAVQKSFDMTKGYFREIAGYAGVIILLSLVAGVVNLFIPVFGNMLANAVTIVYGVIGAWLYRWLAK